MLQHIDGFVASRNSPEAFTIKTVNIIIIVIIARTISGTYEVRKSAIE